MGWLGICMKKVLVLCAQDRDYRELSFIKDEYDFIFHELNNLGLQYCLRNASEFNDTLKIIKDLISEYKEQNIDAVLSSNDYPGIIFAAILAKELNLVAPEIEQIILCQHKYYCRLQQKKVIPECVPNFHLLENENKLGYPFFVKPVKSAFSLNSKAIKSPSDLKDILSLNPVPKNFTHSFEQVVQNYSSIKDPVDRFLAEELIEGHQVTIEGFVFRGRVYFLGIVDSNFYQDTICFESFIYPTTLPENVQNRIKDISKKFIKFINFDNGFFNIEFIYNFDKDSLHLIEINPRISPQFADLYEKVDGTNSYKILLKIVLNEEPKVTQNEGQYSAAGSFVLRVFNDAIVKRIPLPNEIDRAKFFCPDMRLEIYAKSRCKLSDFPQDGKSFRYAVYNIGAKSREKLRSLADEIKSILNFQFL